MSWNPAGAAQENHCGDPMEILGALKRYTVRATLPLFSKGRHREAAVGGVKPSSTGPFRQRRAKV